MTGKSTLTMIFDTAQEMFSVPSHVIRAAGTRMKTVTDARCAVTYVMRNHLKMSHSDISSVMGGVHHSSSVTRLRRAERLIESDEQFKRRVDLLLARAGEIESEKLGA